jgi:hypothetical protein
MPLVSSTRSTDIIFAAFAITAVCCASLHAVLKSVYRSECINDNAGEIASDGIVRPTAIACIAAAALSLVANIVFALKIGIKEAWAVAASICSKWQPLYFAVVSAQRVILRVVVFSRKVQVCPLSSQNEGVIQAAMLVLDCAILVAGVSIIARDCAMDWLPVKRRFAYFALTTCLLVDAISSFISGNVIQTGVSLSIGDFNFLLDNQIASCITSQAIIALHLLFVSCRSRSGRGWAYASLRFELDECGRVSMSNLITPVIKGDSSFLETTASCACVSKPGSSPKSDAHIVHHAVGSSSLFTRLKHQIDRFQERHLSQCRLFVIPCAENDAIEADVCAGFRISRPAFDIRCLRPLQRLADAHPKKYCSFGFFVFAIPATACNILMRSLTSDDSIQILSSCIVFMNSGMLIMALGYVSSKQHGLDRVAVKHVASSFRFLTCVFLLVGAIVLQTRFYLALNVYPMRAVAFFIICLFFLASLLLDCSPNLPASIQIFITVKSFVAFTILRNLTFLSDRLVHTVWLLDH